MPDLSPWITEVTVETFQSAVVDRSCDVPVVVDLWAPWCAPCRQLTPMLERLAQEHAGRFVLAKVNIDDEPEIAQAFQVQSIPYVIALRNGQPVNDFVGVLPEPQLREWVGSLLPSRAEELLRRGESLEAEDAVSAEECYREALELDPSNDGAKLRLARVLLAQQRDEECRRLLAELEARGFLEPEAEQVKSQLELRSAAAEAGGVEEARRAVQAHPDDLSLKLKLADALAVAGRHREAMEVCIEVVRCDRAGMGEQARETMVNIFNMLGPNSPLVGEYRRKLATALY